MKHLLSICFFFIAYTSNLSAQSDSLKIDSLKKVLATEKQDTSKVNTLNALSYQYYYNGDSTNALNYAGDALTLAQKTKFKKGQSIAYINIGAANENKANFKEAIRNYFIALSISQSLGDNKLVGASFSNIGNAYNDLQDSTNSLKYFNNALSVYKKINDEAGLADTYSAMGGWYAYGYLNNSNEALKYFLNALSLYDKVNNSEALLRTCSQVAFIYRKLSDNYNAVKCYDLALKSAEKSGDNESIGDVYWSIANTNQFINRATAISDYYKALPFFEKAGNKNLTGDCLEKIGYNYYYLENYQQSHTAYLQAIKIYQKINSFKGLASCYIYVANIYRIQKQYNEALNYDSTALKISISIKDEHDQAMAYYSLGDIYANQNDRAQSGGITVEQSISLKKSLTNYVEALHLYKKQEDVGGMGDAYQSLASVNITLRHFSEAQKYADSALLYAKISKFTDNFKHSYLLQSTIDSTTGNFKGAFESYKKYIFYRDSIVNDQNTKKSLQASMQYDFDKKESIAKTAQEKKDADAKRIKNQQYFAIGTLGIIVLAVLIIALIQFKNNKQKQKANNLITQQKQKVETTLSELKSTQAQLIQSEKMASLGELTAGIAHEIQNPLNFVNNFSEVNKEMLEELKAERLKPNAERDDDLQNDLINDVIANEEKINHHGKRADAIVKGMLQHSRQTKGIKEPTDINALCDEYLRLSYHGFRAKDKSFTVDFKTDFDKSIGKINIVPQDIGRVLLNLFNNAFYAVLEKQKTAGENYKPLVTVATKSPSPLEKGWVEVIVSDNGNGIPANIIDKIFQPFFTTKPTGEGTGLGLSLAYDIITKEHNGSNKSGE